jgi:hypothetical protein
VCANCKVRCNIDSGSCVSTQDLKDRRKRERCIINLSKTKCVRWRTVPNRAPLHLRSRRISADASVVKAGVRTGGGDDGGGRCVSSGLSDMYRISTGCI